MIPPIFLNIRIRWFWFPLPLFFFWPLFAIAWIILGLALTGAFIGLICFEWTNTAPYPNKYDPDDDRRKITGVGKIWLTTWQLLCAFRGATVEVDTPPHKRVIVSII
jgi:hypothetical protein